MRFPLLCIAFLMFSTGANAQASLCGSPPPVENTEIKGDINGKAQFLSKFLGDASLGGKIQESRTEIFSKYKNIDERSNAYFEYQVCIILMNDTKMSTSDKLDKLTTIHNTFKQPILSPKTESRDGPNVTFGCTEGNKSIVTYDAPPGFIINGANASIIDSVGAKTSSATVTSRTPTNAVAQAEFMGRDREWTGNCPGGGHGAVRLTVDITPK